MFTLNTQYIHNKTMNINFQHTISNTHKSVSEIYEIKKKKIPKPTLPIKNHVLYEFCPSDSSVELERNANFMENNDNNSLVEFVIDSHIDMGELYNGGENENIIEYNPMNFSLRHYISSK